VEENRAPSGAHAVTRIAIPPGGNQSAIGAAMGSSRRGFTRPSKPFRPSGNSYASPVPGSYVSRDPLGEHHRQWVRSGHMGNCKGDGDADDSGRHPPQWGQSSVHSPPVKSPTDMNGAIRCG